MYGRIVIKLSGEALCGGGRCFDDEIISRITGEIISIMRKGVQTALVVGGGNFWRGRDTRDGMDRSRSDQIGMLATIMNAIYLSEAFAAKGTNAVVMTPFYAHNFSVPFEKYNAISILENGGVAIFAGGCGLPYFSTDTITAVRAGEINADAVLFAKNIDGIYDRDPKKFTDSKKYAIISYDEIVEKNLGAIDISAVSILKEQKAKSVVFALDAKNGIELAATGNDEELYQIGTKIIL